MEAYLIVKMVHQQLPYFSPLLLFRFTFCRNMLQLCVIMAAGAQTAENGSEKGQNKFPLSVGTVLERRMLPLNSSCTTGSGKTLELSKKACSKTNLMQSFVFRNSSESPLIGNDHWTDQNLLIWPN